VEGALSSDSSVSIHCGRDAERKYDALCCVKPKFASLSTTLTVRGVDYAKLVGDTSLRNDFEAACKRGIEAHMMLSAPPVIIKSDDISLTLRPGSVIVEAVITVEEAMMTTTLQNLKGEFPEVLGAIKNLPSLASVSNGPVSLDGGSTTTVTTTSMATTTPASGTTAAAAADQPVKPSTTPASSSGSRLSPKVTETVKGTVDSTGNTVVTAATGSVENVKPVDSTGKTAETAATGSLEKVKPADSIGKTVETAATGSVEKVKPVDSTAKTAETAATGSVEKVKPVDGTAKTAETAATGNVEKVKPVDGTGSTENIVQEQETLGKKEMKQVAEAMKKVVAEETETNEKDEAKVKDQLETMKRTMQEKKDAELKAMKEVDTEEKETIQKDEAKIKFELRQALEELEETKKKMKQDGEKPCAKPFDAPIRAVESVWSSSTTTTIAAETASSEVKGGNTTTAAETASSAVKGKCTNTPEETMVTRGLTCETFEWMWTHRCNANASVNKFRNRWITHKFCQKSCWSHGNPYDGDDCSEDTEDTEEMQEAGVSKITTTTSTRLPDGRYKIEARATTGEVGPLAVWAMDEEVQHDPADGRKDIKWYKGDYESCGHGECEFLLSTIPDSKGKYKIEAVKPDGTRGVLQVQGLQDSDKNALKLVWAPQNYSNCPKPACDFTIAKVPHHLPEYKNAFKMEATAKNGDKGPLAVWDLQNGAKNGLNINWFQGEYESCMEPSCDFFISPLEVDETAKSADAAEHLLEELSSAHPDGFFSKDALIDEDARLVKPCKKSKTIDKPIDKSLCKYKEWSEWSTCKPFCAGKQSRVRETDVGELNDRNCSETFEQESCSNICVDCEWSVWSDWSACPEDAHDEKRLKKRNRIVATPKQGGGKTCSGPDNETKECTDDCTVSDWGEWSKCEPCSMTQATRSRTAAEAKPGSDACKHSRFNLVEKKICWDNTCSNPCAWGDWHDWEPCSKSCGADSTRQRGRNHKRVNLPGGIKCTGVDLETDRCNFIHVCPEEASKMKAPTPQTPIVRQTPPPTEKKPCKHKDSAASESSALENEREE